MMAVLAFSKNQLSTRKKAAALSKGSQGEYPDVHGSPMLRYGRLRWAWGGGAEGRREGRMQREKEIHRRDERGSQSKCVFVRVRFVYGCVTCAKGGGKDLKIFNPIDIAIKTTPKIRLSDPRHRSSTLIAHCSISRLLPCRNVNID